MSYLIDLRSLGAALLINFPSQWSINLMIDDWTRSVQPRYSLVKTSNSSTTEVNELVYAHRGRARTD